MNFIKYIFFICLVSLSFHQLSAQSSWRVVSSGGAKQSTGSVTVHSTLCQLSNHATNTAKSGFQFQFDPAATSIKDHSAFSFQITMYPNPSTDRVTISTAQDINATIWIHDASGNFIDQKKFNGNHLELILNELPKGQYYISIIDDTHYYSAPLQLL